MRKIIIYTVCLNLFLYTSSVYAIPGPIIAGSAGLLGFIITLVSIGFGVSIFYLRKSISCFFSFGKKHLIITGVLISTLIVYGVFIFREGKKDDMVNVIHEYLNSKSYDFLSPKIYDHIISRIEISEIHSSSPDNSALDKEIRYTMEANRNIIWNRYLITDKIAVSQELFDKIQKGEFSISLENFLDKIEEKEGNTVTIDLRTAEEFHTSAHFKNALNYEYGEIINSEIPFRKDKTYLIFCHDGMIDISRSLIVAIYLQSKGIHAYAVESGMRPILKSLALNPINFDTKFQFMKYGNQKGLHIIDVLGAIKDLDIGKDLLTSSSVYDFMFYKYPVAIYNMKMEEIRNMSKNSTIYFACYDNFSCFYSKIFIEKLHSNSNAFKILIIQ